MLSVDTNIFGRTRYELTQEVSLRTTDLWNSPMKVCSLLLCVIWRWVLKQSRNFLEMMSNTSIRWSCFFNTDIYYLVRNLKLTNKWTNTEVKGLAEIGSVLYISYNRKIAANFWVGWGNKSLFCSRSTWNWKYLT